MNLKEQGNKLYKEENYTMAINKYSEAISHFRYFMKGDTKGERMIYHDSLQKQSHHWTNEQSKIIKNLIVTLNLNAAQCYFQMNKHKDLVWCCM